MTNRNFTDEEIRKALVCCASYDCTACPLYSPTINCVILLPEKALELVDRQRAEIERLNAVYADGLETLRLAAEANKDMQAEVKRLEHTTSGLQSRLKNSKVVEFRRITSFEPFKTTTEKESGNESQNT